jgi:peptide/nickel transport system permease protein
VHLFLIKRLLGMIPLLIGITMISFAMIHLAPGEPSVVGQQLNPRISAQDIERLRSYYGLDKPLTVQYWDWLKRLTRFDFGNSFSADSRPVIAKIKERVPITLWINILAMLLMLVVAIPIGVASAVHQNSWMDRIMTVFVFLGFAVPNFWLGLMLMIGLGVNLNWFPIAGIHSYGWQHMGFWAQQRDLMWHLTIPVLVSAIALLAGMSRFMRSGMLEVIRSDFITTARSLGVPEPRIRYRLALKNAMLPIITLLGLSIPGLIGGSVIIEKLFSIPGMGLLFYEAVMARDYPLIMGITVIGAILTLLGNLLADLAYAWADPRIRHGGKA